MAMEKLLRYALLICNSRQVALQTFAAKSGFLKSSMVASLEDLQSLKWGVRYTHVQTLHFNSDSKRMTVVFHDLQTGTNEAFMKGAPERVLEACVYDLDQKHLTEDSKMEVVRLVEQFASEGLVGPKYRDIN
jgi:magnesium-transporting ATPase (P-type)